MKPVNSIDRSFQNHKNEVQETDVAKSGLNLTYRNHLGGLVLGRLYPQAFQHLMPADKISGNNEASLTFEQLSTPVVDDMDVCVHNFLVTLRSIDNRWEKFMTPTKLNNMNKNVSVPTFQLGTILSSIVSWLSFNVITLSYPDNKKTMTFNIAPFLSFNLWDSVYHSDSMHDLYYQLKPYFPGSDSQSFDIDSDDGYSRAVEILVTIFDFFVGKRSLLDYFGYLHLTEDTIRNGLSDIITRSNYYPTTLSFNDLMNNSEDDGRSQNFFNTQYVSDDDAWKGSPVYPLQNEYSLRAYYAIWFEYYRNYDLEPRSASLPEYRDFGGTTIFNDYSMQYLHYLVPRIRSWQQDAFTTAGIDDISRHVFAPLLDGFTIDNTMDTSLQPSGILDNNTVMQQISWRNPATGAVATIDCPIPTRLISTLQSSPTTMNTYGIELLSLRKAQMLENYLKRIYYGGDEYRDRMLHLYGSRIEDYRINRPQWLSSSLDMVSPRQEVANTGVKPGDDSGFSIGERLVTATAEQRGNDGFTEFCPEFGIYISMLSIMPHATYDPYIMQNLQVKYTDFPIPQFANQMEDVINTLEISRSNSSPSAFGYAPYGHSYRYRVDEVHGDYHDTKYDYVFLRFFDDENVPNLSWSFIHCRPKLPMFVDSVLLDGQVYGTFKHNFLVERALPSPVEVI